MKKLLVTLILGASLLNPYQTEAQTKTVSQMKWYSFKATFYKAYGNSRTKTGTVPKNNRTLSVDPRVIPLGSVVEIIYRDHKKVIREIRLAEDTGGSIKNYKVDIFYNAPRKKLLQLGLQKIQLRVISYPSKKGRNKNETKYASRNKKRNS